MGLEVRGFSVKDKPYCKSLSPCSSLDRNIGTPFLQRVKLQLAFLVAIPHIYKEIKYCCQFP
jgi:hypothetical protein